MKRVYHEPIVSSSAYCHITRCPKCRGFLAEERQQGESGRLTPVMFCIIDKCGWREWTMEA